MKEKGASFTGTCFPCGQYGHMLSECPKKDANMLKGNGVGGEAGN